MDNTTILDFIMLLALFIGVGLVLFGILPMISGRLDALRATCIGLGAFGFVSMVRYWYIESYHRSLPESVVSETVFWFFISSLLIFLGYWISFYKYSYIFKSESGSYLLNKITWHFSPDFFIAISVAIALIYPFLGGTAFIIVGHLLKAFIVLFFYLWVTKKNYKYLYITIFLFSFSVFDTSRRAYISLFIPCFLIYFASFRKTRKKRFSLRFKILSIAILFSLFIFLNWLRSEHNFGEGYIEGDQIANTMNYMTTLKSVDVFYNTGFIINNIPERYDYFYGETYLSILVGLIPRSVWPEKPVSLGAILGLMVRFDFGKFNVEMWESSNQYSLSPGFIGEAYANFGYPGIIFLSLALGFILGVYDKKISRLDPLDPKNFPWFIWLGSFILLHRGDAYGAVIYQIFIFIFLIVLLRLLVKNNRVGVGKQ